MNARRLLQEFRAKLAWYANWSRLSIVMVIATTITVSVLAGGVPALQHDWWFPAHADAMQGVVDWYADGWSPYGFGSAQPYPTFFPLVPLWLLCSSHFIPIVGLAVCIFVTSVIAALAATSLLVEKTWYLVWPLAGIAAANPWVYNEYHAGHVYMVSAYAIDLALCAEVFRTRPRERVLCVLAALSVLQIEFSVLLTIPLAVWLYRKRFHRPLAVLVAFLAPIVYGIAASYRTIHGTPYGLDWQRAESIHLLDGFLLRGYSHDVVHSVLAQTVALAILAMLALYGACFCVRTIFERGVCIAAVAVAVYASGLSTFFGPCYMWIVLHVKESGLFRELYDLIAFVAVAYVFALAAFLRKHRSAGVLVTAAATVVLLPWITQPLSRGIVATSALPQVALPHGDQLRVLLLPAFQPMSFHGAGSGIDPDAFIVPHMATPLNEWLPTYPVNAALAYAEVEHRYAWAQALGVREIISRPYLESDSAALADQGTHVGVAADASVPLHMVLPHPVSLLSFIDQPAQLTSIGNAPNEHATFFGDLQPQLIDTFVPSLVTHDPVQAWTDARVDVPGHPEEASAFGGVVTASREALPIPHRLALLARADGRLLDNNGHVIVGSVGPLAWHMLPRSATSVHCEGRCTVILAGDPPPGLPAHASALHARVTAVHVDMLMPWFGVAILAPHSGGVLRYNTRYDWNWLAVIDGKRLVHFPLDTAINAWNVDSARVPRRIVLVQVTAFIQTMLEVLALLVLAVLFKRSSRSSSRPH